MITKLTEWQSAMLEKLVGDEMVRARESAQPLELLNDLAALRDTLLRADAPPRRDAPADGGCALMNTIVILNRLLAARCPSESYSDAIVRRANGEAA